MDKSDYDEYERRLRVYHSAFEEYNSLYTTYQKFYTASDAFQKRANFLTLASTLLSGILLFVIGAVLVQRGPDWGTELAFGISVIVAGLSFVNAVENPHRMANVTYNSGQTLQRVYLEFHWFVTVRLPDPSEDIEDLEDEYERLLERKHTVNETTPSLGSKWYDRVKEDKNSWEPKPLTEITGKDGEFEVESDSDEKSLAENIWGHISSPFSRIIRRLGF